MYIRVCALNQITNNSPKWNFVQIVLRLEKSATNIRMFNHLLVNNWNYTANINDLYDYFRLGIWKSINFVDIRHKILTARKYHETVMQWKLSSQRKPRAKKSNHRLCYLYVKATKRHENQMMLSIPCHLISWRLVAFSLIVSKLFWEMKRLAEKKEKGRDATYQSRD